MGISDAYGTAQILHIQPKTQNKKQPTSCPSSSERAKADRVAYSMRRHYAIESKHWQLDVVLRCRTILKTNKAENKVNKRPLFSALFVFNAK
jgi:hypothetical protein